MSRGPGPHVLLERMSVHGVAAHLIWERLREAAAEEGIEQKRLIGVNKLVKRSRRRLISVFHPRFLSISFEDSFREWKGRNSEKTL